MLTDKPSLNDRLADELDEARDHAISQQPLVEPTDEEKRNGWTAETLTAYLAERKAGQDLSIDVDSLQRKLARRPTQQNHRYNPLRWR